MSAVIPERALERLAELAFAALFVLGLSLVVLAAAAGLRWLSADWNNACHRLLRAPPRPGFAAPWRVADNQPQTPCLHPRP